MSRFEQIETEYSHGSVGNYDYASKVRILMRSPTAFMFTAHGVNYHVRGERLSPHDHKICGSSRYKDMDNDAVRAKIVKIFGEGADDAALLAIKTRGMGTVLVDGGGEKLCLPRADNARDKEARHAMITPSAEYLPEGVKRCPQCDQPLRLDTDRHRFGPVPQDGQPTTLEMCQRLTNHPIVKVHGYPWHKDESHWPYVERFETWDGESYLDHIFCSNMCAAQYGERAYEEGVRLEIGGEPSKHVYRPREDRDYYERKESEWERLTRLDLEAQGFKV